MKTENINGFIWAVLEYDDAFRRFTNDEDVQEITEDGEGDLIWRFEEFGQIIENHKKVGFKIGEKEDLEADYQDSKENRTFEDWCLSKIE